LRLFGGGRRLLIGSDSGRSDNDTRAGDEQNSHRKEPDIRAIPDDRRSGGATAPDNKDIHSRKFDADPDVPAQRPAGGIGLDEPRGPGQERGRKTGEISSKRDSVQSTDSLRRGTTLADQR